MNCTYFENAWRYVLYASNADDYSLPYGFQSKVLTTKEIQKLPVKQLKDFIEKNLWATSYLKKLTHTPLRNKLFDFLLVFGEEELNLVLRDAFNYTGEYMNEGKSNLSKDETDAINDIENKEGLNWVVGCSMSHYLRREAEKKAIQNADLIFYRERFM